MVTTTFDRQSQLMIEFPSPNNTAKPINKNKEMIEISIDDKGNYYVNKQQLISSSRDALERALRVAITGKKNLATIPVVVSAHAKAKHQHVINAMYTSRQLGLLNILFATVKSGQNE